MIPTIPHGALFLRERGLVLKISHHSIPTVTIELVFALFKR